MICPWLWGWWGARGNFLANSSIRCMFLGELSLDGTVRPVRGALSAALAAREIGLQSVAVPEANAKEAAVVEGVNVFALKSLPQPVDLVNSPESIAPVRVDAALMLSEAAQYSVDMRRSGPASREARSGSGVRGRAQHFIYRAAGCWQNHAGEAYSYNLAAHVTRRGH